MFCGLDLVRKVNWQVIELVRGRENEFLKIDHYHKIKFIFLNFYFFLNFNDVIVFAMFDLVVETHFRFAKLECLNHDFAF